LGLQKIDEMFTDGKGNLDYSKIKKTILEGKENTLPVNTIEAINLINEELGIDAINNTESIEQAIFSIADKLTSKARFNGSAKLQVPVTGWEDMAFVKNLELSQTMHNGKPVVSSGILKPYRKEIVNGIEIVKSAEVFLPYHLKDELIRQFGVSDLSKISPKMLDLVGFRIPTQGGMSI
jgi:hypothetical protein